jgi:hypothetical protein
VSWASPTVCVAIATPTWATTFDGSTWSALTSVGQAGDTWRGVSCAGSALCVAVQSHGAAVVFNGLTWSAPQIPDQAGLDSVSCATSTFCLATDAYGGYVTYDGSEWTEPQTIPAGAMNCVPDTCFTVVSCATPTYCLVADKNNASAALFADGTWAKQAPVTMRMSSASCSAVGMCALLTQGGQSTSLVDGQWSPLASPIPGKLPNALSCGSPTFCVAVVGT